MLKRLCQKRSNNVARHDKTPGKSTLLSRDTNFMSRRSHVASCCNVYTFRSCNTSTFSVTTFQCCDIRHNFLLSFGIL